ncbi:unnamed protein product [Closterium sp. Naga37s-1]|nr:unnamed protein product [Closterium sp. Naga37s-1]
MADEAEEHEVYGGDIPEEAEGEYEGDLEGTGEEGEGAAGATAAAAADGAGSSGGASGAASGAATGGEGGEDAAAKELEEMKKRLREMEEEAAALREMQARVEKEMGAVPEGGDPNAVSQASREEADARSVFVGNVDYACTPEEVQQHFQSCGTVNRVTILTDRYGQPKGFAYVEFLEVDAVQNAVLLNESELHGRPLKVVAKRTNVPGMKAHRFRRPGYRPFRPGGPGGYGRAPRFRRPFRYRPYY